MKRPRALRFRTGGVRRVVHRTADAARTIGPHKPGDRVTGLTAGQFSAIDAMEHLCAELGPAEVLISTWTTGLYDVHRAKRIEFRGRITGIRMLLDRGTFEKSPLYAGPLIEVLGADAIRCLSVHAKVTVVLGERGWAAWRSSMNLNKNLRTEQFDIDVEEPGSEGVADFYRRWFKGLWLEAGRSTDNRAIITAVYDRWLAAEAGHPEAPKPAPRRRDRSAPRIEDVAFSLDDLDPDSIL